MNTTQPPLSALALCGSLRESSYNRKALRLAMKHAQHLGILTTEADLRKLNIPLYDADLEAAELPSGVQKLKQMIRQSDLLLIASPEYNHSIPGVLKNAIDWASSKDNAFDGKVAMIFGASNGPFGTARMQPQLRQVLGVLNVLVTPQPIVMISNAQTAFTAEGAFVDAKLQHRLELLVEKTIAIATAMRGLRTT